jgi:putative glycosyl hydrolase-like family 15 (GHL15) protein
VNAPGSRRIAALAIVLSVFVFPATDRQSARAAGSSVASTAALRICSTCVQNGGNLSRYGYVILNSWDAPLLPALKAANPGLKALVYKNLSFTTSTSCANGVDQARLPAGVGYCDSNANHPDWFLTDTTGARINSVHYPQSWLMDVGNAGYQAKWLSNVLADLQVGGWDGVFMDDTDADMGYHLNGQTISRYPTGSAWRAATRSMLANVGPALQSAGFLAVPNLYTPWLPEYDAQATWRDWIGLTSGAAQEYYSKWGSDSSSWFSGSDWTFRQQFQAITEQAGKIFLGITYSPKSDTRSMTWARANFLLFDDPADHGALVYEFSDPESQDPYAPQWTAEVGSPTGARFQVGAAWRRNFTGGTVLVNPSSSTVTVSLDKAYLNADGTSTTSVTLAPTTGAILTSTTTATPTPSPVLIALRASVSGSSVTLSWSGMTSASTDVFRNSRRLATVANNGSYVDTLPKNAKSSYSYRVCAAGTSVCSASVSVTAGAGTQYSTLSAPKLRASFKHRYSRSFLHASARTARRHSR